MKLESIRLHDLLFIKLDFASMNAIPHYWANPATLVARHNGKADMIKFLQVLENWSSDPEKIQ